VVSVDASGGTSQKRGRILRGTWETTPKPLRTCPDTWRAGPGLGEDGGMSFSGAARVPRTPTLPQGETVASYATYLEAQRAVDHLSDRQFPVQLVTIVGTELKMVERVTGRLTYARVAMGGFGSGAWFGLFIGLLFLLTSDNVGILLTSVLVGGGFGLLFSVIIYSFTGGKRDFTSQSQIVASQYAVLCQAEKAGDARQLLRELGGVRPGGAATAPVAAPPAGRPSDPAATYPAAPVAPPAAPPAGTPPEQPRYGQLAPQPPEQPRYGQYAPPSAAPAAPAAQPAPEQPGPDQQD
jgi:hypothetical protein